MRAAVVTFAALLISAPALAQTPTTAPAAQTTPRWSFSASVYTYILPESENYVQPTVTADRGSLHLEARFNYEGLDTGSTWLGYNFSAGSGLTLEITPMIGVAFGDTTGVTSGYKGSLEWRALGIFSETEFVFDVRESADSFLYTWSEFAVAPVDWFRFGYAVQRTKAYETDFEIQRGLFAGFSYKRANIGAYFFDSGGDKPTVVMALGASF